jgi:hypothetical protein
MKTPAELIKAYLKRTKMKKLHFCRQCHIHRASLYKYLHGEPIHPFKARAIEYGTNKELLAEDLIRKI